MKKSLIITFLCALVLSSAFRPRPVSDDDISGTWMRTDDRLLIKIEQDGGNMLSSHIVAEGTDKFPCDVSAVPIYKNIAKVKNNLWKCDFLVVTMGSCSLEYEEGMIRINREGHLEVICPGFSKKIYSKLKPRYDS